MFLGLLSTQSIATYRKKISPMKGYRCAHANCEGGESCSDFISRLLSQQAELGESQVRKSIANRLRECKASSEVRGLSTSNATLKMLTKYGVVGAAAFLASAGVFAATCTTGESDGGGGCGGGGSSSGDNCEPTLPKTTLIEGKVYFAATEGTQVFWDENNNWTKDPTEDAVFVDLDGNYAIKKSAFSTAKLLAETDLLASDRNGFVGGRVMMAASGTDLTRISPFITLMELSGRSATEVSAVIGLPANAVLSPEQFATDQNVWQTSSIVRTMLSRQNEELADYGQANVGKALMTHLNTIYSGGSLDPEEDLSLRQSLQQTSNRKQALQQRALPAAVLGIPTYKTAVSVPSVPRGWSSPNISNLKYTWVNSVDPNLDSVKYQAVQDALKELEKYGANVTVNGLAANLNRLDNNTISRILGILQKGGVVLDSEEQKLSENFSAAHASIAAQRRTEKEKLEGDLSGVKQYLVELANPDVLFASIEFAAGVYQVRTGAPIGIVGTIGTKVPWMANRDGIKNKILYLAKVLSLEGGCIYDQGKFINHAYVSEAEFNEIIGDLIDLARCGIELYDTKEWVKYVSKILLDNGSSAVAAMDYGIKPSPEAKLMVASELFGYMADSTSIGLNPSLMKISGIFSATAALFKVSAEGFKSANNAIMTREKAYAEIDRKYDDMDYEINNRKWQTKLRYRLSKVVREELTDLSDPVIGANCSTSKKYATCVLRSFLGSTAIKFSSGNTGDGRAHALAVESPQISVDFGDGWSTVNDPAYAGKKLIGNETLTHSYLTYGNYRVVTTTKVGANKYTHVSDLVIAPSTETTIPSAPTIQQLTGSAKFGVGVAVNAILSGEAGTTFQSLTAEVEALNAKNELLGTCTLSFNTPSGSFGPGAYFANGCPELSLASAQKVRVSASAVTTDINQTAKSSVLLSVDKSSTNGISLGSLQVSQASDGLPLNGSFTLNGNIALSMVRIHAGRSGESTYYCYLDLIPTLGQKSFMFSGAWVNENGKSCAALLPTQGSSSSLLFKLEVRDSNGTAVNGVSTPVTATYRTTSTVAPIVNQHTPTTATQNRVTTFTYSGSNLVSGLNVALSGCDVITDLGGNSSARSFSCSPKSSGIQTLTVKSAANDATIYTGKVTVAPSGEPITVTGLTATQSGADQPINGSFTVSGSSVSLIRVHAGIAANDSYCYQDLPLSTGIKSFSFSGAWVNENSKTCSSLLPAPGNRTDIVFKVEVRDKDNNLANEGMAPSVTAAFNVSQVSPIMVTGLNVQQSSPGQPANGSFTVSGSSVNLVRVHAGIAANDSYCYQDLAASTGSKSFSFSGTWVNENGKSCSSLLPVPGGSTNIVFKVEARDNNNNLANAGSPPAVTTTYQAALQNAEVTGRSPSTLRRGQATYITVTGVAFPSTVAFAIDDVVCQGDYVRTTTSVRQTCTAQPGTPSSVGLLVKDRSGGSVLSGGNKNFKFTIQ